MGVTFASVGVVGTVPHEIDGLVICATGITIDPAPSRVNKGGTSSEPIAPHSDWSVVHVKNDEKPVTEQTPGACQFCDYGDP